MYGREASRQRDPITFVVAYFNDDEVSMSYTEEDEEEIKWELVL